MSHRYFIIHKPYHMLSQFRGGHPGLRMLGDLGFPFPEGTHAVGRLDHTSEGLLLATTDKSVTRRLFLGEQKHRRTYLVQAYKAVSDTTLHRLRTGITIRIQGGADYTTTPCGVEVVARPAGLPFTNYELRPDIPQTWMTITLTEGKYRQIRKMLQEAGHPCRRLIRLSIEELALGGLAAGAVREVAAGDFFTPLHL